MRPKNWLFSFKKVQIKCDHEGLGNLDEGGAILFLFFEFANKKENEAGFGA